jgi:hypothetical protein
VRSSRSGIAALAFVLFLATAAGNAQVPAPGARSSSSHPARSAASPTQSGSTSGPAVISPITPRLASPEVPSPAAGPVTALVAERASAIAARAAALAPSAERYVPVTITSRAGGRVPTLALDDLAIVEDGVRQRALAIERWPLWLVVVLDVSRQVGPIKQLAVHRQLVYDILYGLGEDDHVAVVQYSDGIDLIQPWTSERTEAENAVEAKFESGLDGQLWESLAYSAEHLFRGKLGHKVVVCITDGVDETSHDLSYDRALELVREEGVTVHIVNLGRYLEEHIRREAYGVNGVLNVIKSPSYVGRRKELRQYGERLGTAPVRMDTITSESGGMLWTADPEKDPLLLPKLVWEQVEGQFMVAYSPSRDDAAKSVKSVRSISAFATRGDVQIRTPTKLYAPIAAPRTAPRATTLRRHK